MFKNRSIQIRMAKDEPKPEQAPLITAEAVQEVASQIVYIYAMCKGINTTCRLVEHLVVTKIK